jgi:hypothetical protein
VPTFRYYALDSDGKPVATGYLELPNAEAAILGGIQQCEVHAAKGASGFEIWQGNRIVCRTMCREMPDDAGLASSADER